MLELLLFKMNTCLPLRRPLSSAFATPKQSASAGEDPRPSLASPPFARLAVARLTRMRATSLIHGVHTRPSLHPCCTDVATLAPHSDATPSLP